MSLLNSSAVPFYKTKFPLEVTLRPGALGGSSDEVANRFGSQIYHPIKNGEVAQCVLELQKLKGWPKNWDGYNAKKPKEKAINFSGILIANIFNISYALNRPWHSPHVSADSDGNIVLEWWGENDKKITLYLDENSQIEYIKSDTPSISEMEDGVIDNFDINTYQELFGWLDE